MRAACASHARACLLSTACSAECGCALQIGNLYGALGRLYLDQASSLSGAFQARYKKQMMPAEVSQYFHPCQSPPGPGWNVEQHTGANQRRGLLLELCIHAVRGNVQAKEAFSKAFAAYKTCLGESQEQCKELQGRMGTLHSLVEGVARYRKIQRTTAHRTTVLSA